METIKVTKVAGSYYLKIPHSYSGTYYEIDGTKFIEAQEVIFQEPPEYAWKYVTNKLKDHYEVGDSSITIEEYEKALKVITGDCQCDPVFSTLEEEYAYKKFLQDHKLVYRDEVVREPIRLDFQEFGDSKNKYIQSHRFIGRDLEKCLYQYTPNSVQMAREIATSLGFKEVEDKTWNENTKGMFFSIPSHSGIDYMKVNGQYVQTGNNKIRLGSIHAGTLKECEEAFNKDWRGLERIFIEQKSLITHPEFDSQAVFEGLIKIEGRIRSINYKSSSRMEWVSAIRAVEDLKESISRVKKEVAA